MNDRFTFGARSLAIVSPEALDEVGPAVSAPFVAMLPAAEESDARGAASLAGDLVRMGCVEICCVGPNAETVHDSVDEVVEDLGALDVVTTWHVDMDEGCQYFISTAGGRPGWLLAILAERSDLASLLRSTVRAV